MALRLPGDISTPEGLWDLLHSKRDARTPIPSTRYNASSFHSPLGLPGTVASSHGYFLSTPLTHFDASFFAMSRSEIAQLDPQQRLLLEVVYECMESAGQSNWRGGNTGCYVGSFGEDWAEISGRDTQGEGVYRISGTGDFAVANRVSYEFDLKGPSMTIRTGCSSSLIALHEACSALSLNHIPSALVAGTNLILSPTMTQHMTSQGVLSPSGSCKTFSADADGYARGEAINCIYIKKLDDALRDGDPVRAVIRATALNCDGKTAGLTNPSSAAHEGMMRVAYESAGLDVRETAYVECHGTGTAVGDPLETVAIGNVFGGEGLYIGSVKPNVGHSEGASGLTSLIKAVLALEHRTIPPNINFSSPNPKIPFAKANLKVPVEPTPWPGDRAERVSVNSFGIGGANAHVILDSAASFLATYACAKARVAKPSPHQQDAHLLVLSANTPDSLRRRVTSTETYLSSHAPAIVDIAHTLALRREHLPHRAFGIASADQVLTFSSFQKAPRAVPDIAYVFTGQGAQWAGMGASLMASFPRFRETMAQLDSVLQALPLPPVWTIQDELATTKRDSRINSAEFAQPLCTALQIGLINLLSGWGVRPAAVVGHSSGEIAAAYAAGSISSSAAIIVAYYRGLVTKGKSREGAMAAVGLGREEAERLGILGEAGGVVVACENSPKSLTLSGDAEGVDKVVEALKRERPEVFCRRLKVEMAYHSHHMAEFAQRYEDLIAPHVHADVPKVPFYSTVMGKPVKEANALDATYWRANMEHPVLFSTAVASLLASTPSHPTVLVEIGPHPALAGPLRQIFQAHQPSPSPTYISTLTRNKDQVHALLATAGQLFQQGVPLDFAATNGPGKVLTDLPTYPWQHDVSYWTESRVSRNWRFRAFPHHELLGSRMLESSDIEPAWRNVLRLDSVPWLRDHKIVDDIVFPAAGYIAAIGEALRQTTGSSEYSIRRLVVKSAFVLQEGQTPEFITHLKPVALTESLESEWFDVTITSYDGAKWTKHCVGQARGGSDSNLPVATRSIDAHPRAVQPKVWYPAMKKMGLNYGPRFQCLRDITAHPVRPIASAHVDDDRELHRSVYAVHPTVIDQMLQLFTVAMSNGMARRLDKLAIPAVIGELYISESGPSVTMEVEAHVTPKGAIHGSALATSDGKVVLSLSDSAFNPLETDTSSAERQDNLAAVRLEWRPDINFVPAAELIRSRGNKREAILLVEKVAVLCMIETAFRIATLDIAPTHLRKFRSWLDMEITRMKNGDYVVVPQAQQWTGLPSAERLKLLEKALIEASTDESSKPIASVIQRVLDSCDDVFHGRISGVELLLPDNGLASIYAFYQDMVDFSDFFALLGHAQPTMRILEVGAGTGGTTSWVLEALQTPEGVRLFSEYHYTDVSAGFFPAAKEKFKEYTGIEYAVLDIGKDVGGQGFGSDYDVVVASNVLHATPNLQETLANVRKLLAPGGRLFLQELCPTLRWTNFIMGLLPGWWLGEADKRPTEPFVAPERWDEELRAAGFSGVDSVILDNAEPLQINANILSTAVETVSESKKEVSFLCHAERGSVVQEVADHFVREGYAVNWLTLDHEPNSDQTIIVLLDLNIPILYDISAEDLARIQAFFSHRSNHSNSIIWVSKSAQVRCSDPSHGLLPGFARTVRSELSLDLATFEVDCLGADAWGALVQLSQGFSTRRKNDALNPEYEYAFFDGRIHTGRFHWIASTDSGEPTSAAATEARLEIGKYGLLGSLSWKHSDVKDILRGHEVEVQIRSVGLNFKDVLVSMGIVDGPKDKLGLEGSGVVTRVAPGVANLRVGDRVFICDVGCLATKMVTSAKLCAKIPDSLSFEDAATMPCVYSTVIHSFVGVGGLESGQSVLIHSACGGVGIAAIQVCRMLGAEIYATVGSEEKVQYLIDTFSIPRAHIFDSRSASFLPNLMRETHDRGVDLVLNSLSGELLHASWKCVAPFGKMLEIGKRDFIGHARLNMDIFALNRTFAGIDLAQLTLEKPQVCRKLLEQCLAYYRDGSIEPIRPVKSFKAAHVVDAFRYMQKGQHIGKIVINMPESAQELQAQPESPQMRFEMEKSYLLCGGLGGLGRAVSTWMVERGARHLIYFSRSAGTMPEDTAFFAELKAQGCTARAVAGSVASLEDVRRAISMAEKPIAGVIQLSMVLRDQNFLQMTHEEWQTSISPKVHGTWNLHEAFQDTKLDFFLLFSSLSGIVGQWGQANYATANTFLDSFVQYRHGLGLPASVIDVGMMEDVGYVSQNASLLDKLRAYSMHGLKETDLLCAIETAIKRSLPGPPREGRYCNMAQLTTGLASAKSISDPSNRAIWKHDVRMALYRNREPEKETSSGTASESLQDFLRSVASTPTVLDDEENVDFLTQEIGKRIRSFMIQSDEPIDTNLTLSDLGVDSLVSIEIRNWWRMGLGLEISVLEIMSAGSVNRLGAIAVEGLRAKYGPKEGPHPGLAMKAP
ncbi:putative polyketide synthase [Bimuria novae-zelandiae CBS 107.79]|uniref:Putative polyketide synthase n=1 Tax=Bimuria novae-zelandiae CBS 107.79 TaxID=1447943 RepID=A0A6A5VRB2_9PLEO|nr:putative polyketide synthase [Bimuria novae-zelandiae CBS 107.79]